jgi:hypothetical protein
MSAGHNLAACWSREGTLFIATGTDIETAA